MSRTAADIVITATAEDVERTGRDTTVAQWGVAIVVMVGSAISAGIGFHYLGEHAAIGVITGLGVDLALASGLVIGRRLRAVGITTGWGTVLLWLTGLMTLCLNSGAAVLTGHWALAVAHAFLPALLVVVTEAGSEAQLKLVRLRQQRLAEEQAARRAQVAVERAAVVAEQRRLDGQRQAERDRLERVRAEQARVAELAEAQHQREMVERRQAREHEARQTVASLASVLAIGAALRRRPGGSRPRASTGLSTASRPRSTTARTGRNGRGRSAAPDFTDLVARARPILVREPDLGRRELGNRLGVPPYWAQKAKDAVAEQQRALHVVRSGR
jgi:hypothetical protein